MLVTTGLALLSAMIIGLVVFQPAPSERAQIVSAARIPAGGTHKQVTEYADESSMAGATKDQLRKTADGTFLKVPFALLSGFPYQTPSPEQLKASPDRMARIPANVAALDGEPAMLLGNMVPVEMDGSGNVTSFFLTQNQAYCCYGETPMLNELAYVQIGPGVRPPAYTEKPIAVTGVLEVGEDATDGFVSSVYRMTASAILPPSAYTD